MNIFVRWHQILLIFCSSLTGTSHEPEMNPLSCHRQILHLILIQDLLDWVRTNPLHSMKDLLIGIHCHWLLIANRSLSKFLSFSFNFPSVETIHWKIGTLMPWLMTVFEIRDAPHVYEAGLQAVEPSGLSSPGSPGSPRFESLYLSYLRPIWHKERKEAYPDHRLINIDLLWAKAIE